MNRTILYIEDNYIELSRNTVIATTIEPFNVKDLTKRSIKHTNLFKVPKTNYSLRTLGFLDNEYSQTDKPYKKLPAKAVQNGVEIIKGKAFIKQVNNYIEIAIFEDTVDLFDILPTLNLYELGILTDGPWNAAAMDAARAVTTGVFAPVVDYGKMNATNIANDFYLPSWFYKDIIVSLLESSGFSLSGNILSDDNFTRLFIPFSRDEWKYSKVFIDRYSVLAKGVNGTFAPISSSQKVSGAWTVTGATAGIWNNGFSMIEIPTVGASGDYLQYDINISLHFDSVGATGDEFRYQIIRNRSSVETVLAEKIFTKPGAPNLNADVELEATADLRDGDQVYLKYLRVTGTPTQTHTNVIIDAKNTGKIFDNWVFFNYLLPDEDQISTSGFVKDFYMRFGIIDKLVGNTLHLKTLEEIINDKAGAVDWTRKRKGQSNLDFDYDYAQENYFAYQDALKNNLGRGSISIDNNALNASLTLYNSPFENTDYKRNIFLNTAYLPVYDDAESVGRISRFFQQINNVSGDAQVQINEIDVTEIFKVGTSVLIQLTDYDVTGLVTAVSFDGTKTLVTTDITYTGSGFGVLYALPDVTRASMSGQPGLKLLISRDRVNPEQTIIFNSTPRSDYKVGLFEQPDESTGAGFQRFIDAYYNRFGKSLQKIKLLTRYYDLSEMDILSFDKHKLIYDDGYYLVLSIENYVPGELTKVNILKVN